jgi:PAS domain S-box-containing protein
MFPYTLFYVDDDLKAQKAFLDVFSGYIKSIVCFTDGNKALEAVKNSSFDIFVTAVSIPHVDGLILAKEVKKLYPWLPVIIFSSFENFEIATEAIDIGVEGYISKSVSKEQFIKKMLRIVKKLTLLKNSKHNEILLNQYKEAIDRSSIVSKTDLNGRITYVNEAFCKISGYTQEELLGKSHNIVRHPDMPSSAFQAMWQSIQAKKPWDGVIKNRKKNGDAYYVQSYIHPILDEEGETAEYIAIRKDITELESYKQSLEVKLDKSTREIVETQKEIIYTMGTIGEKRNLETGLHVRRVANYSYLLAKLYGLSEKEAELIKFASPMHDIGKIGIPDAVLNKPGPLNDEEWAIIKEHPIIGYDMLKHSQREILKAAAIISLEHHERYDGKGYPHNLKGEEIHIYGRITAVTDVYDALGNDRVYKKKWELEQIIELFEEERGKQFDPKLTDLFLSNIKEFEKMKESLV